MISNNERIVKNTGMLYFRQLFVLALSLYTSRLTLQILGESDFGVYAAVGGITAFLGVLTSSMAGATQRFITFETGKGNISKSQKIYSVATWIHFGIAIILVFLAETIGLWFLYNKMTIPEERLNVAFWVYQLSIATCFTSIINVPNNACIIAHERMSVVAIVAIIDALLKFSSVFLLFYVPSDKLLWYAIFLSLINLCNYSIYLFYCRRKFPESKFLWGVDMRLAKDLFSFAGWTIVYNLSTSGFVQGTNLILNMFFGPIVNAAYTVAMQAYCGIRQFCSSFQLASTPQIVKLYSVGQSEEMHKLVVAVCKISYFLILFISLPFLINAHFVLTVWLKEVPAHACNFFCLLLCYAYLDVFVYPLDIAAQATGKIRKYNILTSLAILSVLPIAYMLFKYGAIPEIIYVVAIGMSLIGIIVRLLCLSKLIGFRIKYFTLEVLGKSIIVTCISLLLPILFSYYFNSSYSAVLLSFIICLFSVGFSVYIFGLNTSEKTMVMNITRQIFNKLNKNS